MCHGTTTMAGYKVVRRSDPGHGTNVAAVIVTVIVVSTLRCGRKNPGSSPGHSTNVAAVWGI